MIVPTLIKAQHERLVALSASWSSCTGYIRAFLLTGTIDQPCVLTSTIACSAEPLHMQRLSGQGEWQAALSRWPLLQLVNLFAVEALENRMALDPKHGPRTWNHSGTTAARL